jgi:hypothetical protein
MVNNKLLVWLFPFCRKYFQTKDLSSVGVDLKHTTAFQPQNKAIWSVKVKMAFK